MKKITLLILIFPFLLISCKNDPVPFGLMTEFIREPQLTEIMDPKPEFSWIVPSSYEYQEAFQILVASSPEMLASDNGNLWDSQKVLSAKSVNVEYEGEKLVPGNTYYWKAKIWGSNGKESRFSAPQKFIMGEATGYHTTENIFITEEDHPVAIKMEGEGVLVADFGKASFGKLRLEFNPSFEDTLIIHLGEKVDGNGRLDRNPGGSIRYSSVYIAVTPGKTVYPVSLKPDERNTNERAIPLPDSFGVIMPFRYVEIENSPGELKGENLTRTSYFHYFEDDQSWFTSNDTILNQVWELSKYSMKATSFAGLYVDGDRERIPYEADAYINQLGHYCTDREYSMARRTNEYFIETPTWPTEWILFTVPIFMEDYYYTGNKESLEEYYTELKYKTLLALAREDGLISVNSPARTPEFMRKIGFDHPDARIKDIVDWPPANKDTGWELATEEGERDGFEFRDINTVVNAFHYYNLVLMSEMARVLEKANESEEYLQRSEKLKATINEKLINPEKLIYVDGEGTSHSSLHANMFPLAFGLVPEEYKDSVVSFIKSRGMACSVYGAQFLLDGLYRAGEENYALELLTATHDRSWWNMIKIGSTIALEAWDMKYKPNADWNHAWGAAPANIIPRRLWGIRPAEPGFSEVIIEPQMGSLEWSEIKVPTIRGAIKASYKSEGEKRVFEIDIPGNMKGKFRLSGEDFERDLKPGNNYFTIN
jgi:hypothetical protein